MKRILLLLTFILMFFANSSFGDLRHQGAFDEERGEFYFSGLAIYRWSGNERKEFQRKSQTIYKYNFKEKAMEVFFVENCKLRNLSISGDNAYVCVLCSFKNKPRTLIVFNRDREKVLVLHEKVQEFVWHPIENKIIYMTGIKKFRGDDVFIDSTGVWLYDIKKQTKKKIAEKGWNLRTDSLDNNLYYWNGEKTIRYNFYSGKSKETELKEKVEYSPDAIYYVYYVDSGREPPYWSSFRIFDTKENKDLPPTKIGFLSERNPYQVVWGKDSKKLIFKGNLSRTNFEQVVYIYDLESNRVIKQFKGEIAGFNNNRTVLVIYRNGEFFLEKIPEIKSSQ